MNHFMLIMEGYGIRPPLGEAYVAVEGANGELGFYVVSDGSDRPYRVRCRPPCLPPVAALHRMITGEMVADLIPTFGSVNMIGGELDRGARPTAPRAPRTRHPRHMPASRTPPQQTSRR